MIVKKNESLQKAAQVFVQKYPKPGVFAFLGEMGAGKTTFIKEICRELRVSDMVTSPSFALVNEYLTEKKEKIFHFDFYRIKSIQEAFDLGYEEYFYGDSYCFIEWPEKILKLLPETTVFVQIELLAGESRQINFSNNFVP